MRIAKFQAANVKRLKVVEITPKGDVVRVTGANGEGKSSVLDAIHMALAGKGAIPEKPVREGEHRARVRLDLGDVIVTRSFTAKGGTTLTVTAADGTEFGSPQRVLDELVGSLAFDPLEFSRMAPAKQLEQLKGLAKLDVDIDALDRQNAADYQLRTEINRNVKTFTERVHTLANQVGSTDLPENEIDIDELIAQVAGASEFNGELDREERARESAMAMAEHDFDMAKTKREQAAMLLAEAEKLEEIGAAAKARIRALPELPQRRETATLRENIEVARRLNARIGVRSQYRTAKASLDAFQKEADDLTDRMAKRAQQKADAISSAKMPIDGLSFGDGMVVYNGLPFDQASGAEQLRVSMAIAMAANPKLRVLRIKDGSLLDERSMQLIADMAHAENYQCWIESVDTSATVGFTMEDGEVAAIDGVRVKEVRDMTRHTPPELDTERMANTRETNEKRALEVGL